jgi:hypothetical protein
VETALQQQRNTLNEWYAVKQGQWWLRWRWAIWVTAALVVLPWTFFIVYEAITLPFYATYDFDSGQPVPLGIQLLDLVWMFLFPAMSYIQDIVLVSVILLAALLARTCSPPPVHLLPGDRSNNYRFMLRMVRQKVWLWWVLWMAVPLALTLLASITLNYFSGGRWFGCTSGLVLLLVSTTAVAGWFTELLVGKYFRLSPTSIFKRGAVLPCTVFITVKLAAAIGLTTLGYFAPSVIGNSEMSLIELISMAGLYTSHLAFTIIIPIGLIGTAACWGMNNFVPDNFMPQPEPAIET